MKTKIRIFVVAISASLLYFLDFAPGTPTQSLSIQLVGNAEAIAGVRRRARRRGVVVGYTAGEAAANQSNAAAASSTTAASQPKAEPTKAAAKTTTPAPAHGALAMGTVVTDLPTGCESTAKDNVEYYHCGDDYYRTAFQGNQLVYVTTSP